MKNTLLYKFFLPLLLQCLDKMLFSKVHLVNSLLPYPFQHGYAVLFHPSYVHLFYLYSISGCHHILVEFLYFYVTKSTLIIIQVFRFWKVYRVMWLIILSNFITKISLMPLIFWRQPLQKSNLLSQKKEPKYAWISWPLVGCLGSTCLGHHNVKRTK